MKCAHCDAEMMLKQIHCPRCGQKAVFDLNQMAESVHADAAIRRGLQLEGWLSWMVLAILMAGTVLYGVNSLFDKALVYDGSAVPAIQIQDGVAVHYSTVFPPYQDPRPSPALPQAVTRVLGYRQDPIRTKLRTVNGGGKRPGAAKDLKESSAAVAAGLHFLSGVQQDDGSWNVQIYPKGWDAWQTKEFQWLKVSVSSLALLCYLGEGESWLPDEKTGIKSPHAAIIERGIKWLLAQQDAQTGRFGPGADSADSNQSAHNHLLYNHGLATLAMVEAAGLSGDAYLQGVAQKGVDYILKSQTPEGGWNYLGNSAGDSETPLSAWNLQALHSAQEVGLQVPEDALKRALDFYKKSTLFEKDGVRVSWSIKADDKHPRPFLMGVALMMRQLLGEEQKSKELQGLAAKAESSVPSVPKDWGIEWTPKSQNRNDDTRAKYDPYAMYFNTYGMFFYGGKAWNSYNDLMLNAVLTMQDNDGCWRCNDVFTQQAGFVYSTALSILTLQVYYRIQ